MQLGAGTWSCVWQIAACARDRAVSPAQITEQLAAIAPATIRGRTRIPAPARHHIKLKVDGPVHETWTLGYLTDTIYLRDLWMHRIDAARAASRPHGGCQRRFCRVSA
jgi:hypothetical protein